VGDVAIGIGGGVIIAAWTSVALRRLRLPARHATLVAALNAGLVGGLVTYLLAGGARP
jgi:uncharacterized protein (DUF2062 family)